MRAVSAFIMGVAAGFVANYIFFKLFKIEVSR